MVPVVSLLALWGFAAVTTAQGVAGLREAHLAAERVGIPVTGAVTALQAERRAAQRHLAAPGPAGADALDESIRDTDTALAGLRLDGRHTTADAGGLPPETADRVRRFMDATAGLTSLRARDPPPPGTPPATARRNVLPSRRNASTTPTPPPSPPDWPSTAPSLRCQARETVPTRAWRWTSRTHANSWPARTPCSAPPT